MSHNAILAVTGMTGVGKDFMVELANTGQVLPVVNLGTVISQKLGIDRDLMMRAADPTQIEAAQFAAYRHVAAQQPLIVTCHTIRLLNDQLTYHLAMERIFNPWCYVYVTAPPAVIAQRVRHRNARGERKSPELPIPEIDRIQHIELARFKELTAILGCQTLVINNTDEQSADNAALLRKVVCLMHER